MYRVRCSLLLCAALCFVRDVAFAEGSAELDIADTPSNDANDQAVDGSTVLHVDIVDAANEKLCYRGNNTNLDIYRPAPNESTLVASLVTGACTDLIAGVDGAYLVDIGSQTIGIPWDVRVCARGTPDAQCSSDGSYELRGRLFSYDWSFQANAQYIDARSINGSVYAIVPGGATGRDAVIEMQMRGVSGARYHLRANGKGPETDAAARIGRSAPTAGNRVTPQYPLYLNPPAVAKYDWLAPSIQQVSVTPSCGSGVVVGRAPGTIRFQSNLVGQYVLICDVNRDGVYDLAASGDFSSFGTTALGENQVSWDGKTKGGSDAAPGTYSCVVRLDVGEFHYIAEDIETAFPGIRMFRLEADRSTRTPLAMFWDDTLVPVDPEAMPNGQQSPASPTELGLDPGAYAAASQPFSFDGSMAQGNARAWGNFNADGKGNDNFLDQFSSAASTESAPFSIMVVARDTDEDADGLTNARECELGSDPRNPDSDGDHVNDGAEASETSAPDTDMDSRPDVLDSDDDGDGIPTASELGPTENGDGNPVDALDTDHDGKPNYLDTDADDDGVSDAEDRAPLDPARCRDRDADSCDDCARTMANRSGGDPANDGPDADADGLCDASDPDSVDDAGMPVGEDLDLDDDGIPNAVEGPGDLDGDGSANARDLDSDGDGVFDLVEAGGAALDADGDGRIDDVVDDTPRDGLHDALQLPGKALPLPDTDADGAPDFLDADDDGDGRSTRDERDDARAHPEIGPDADGDGQVNWLDTDSDADGLSDEAENQGDGDLNHDGIPDYLQPRAAEPDSDGDGLPDAMEKPGGQSIDTDHDGMPNHMDADDDGDRVPTRDERPNGHDIDTDGDGIPNHLDPDDDGDSIPTPNELQDANKDNVPDYLQRPRGSLAGGALCAVQGPGQAQRVTCWWALALVLLLWRKRGTARAAAMVVVLLGSSSRLQAQVALDPFKPAPLVTDGFGLSRPDVLKHLDWSALLLLEYANDPLVFELAGSRQQQRVVSDHLQLHAAFALGLWDRLTIFGQLPVHLVMSGPEQSSAPVPAPDGGGLGDVALAGRVRLLGDRRSPAAMSGEIIARLPTAKLANSDQSYSGDAIGSYEPALIAEVRAGALALRARAGARLRKLTHVGNLALDHELVYGVGAQYRLLRDLHAHAELYGSTYLKRPWQRVHAPLELLLGLKYHPGDLHAGIAAGPGLSHGYGAPDVRIVALVGYAPVTQQPLAPVARDQDRDGIVDRDDRCVREPEDRDGHDDADGCPDPDNDLDGVLDADDRCPNEAEDRDGFEDADGCPDPDNDHDGVADATDKCPNDPEDRDGFQDDDGCADADNDHDGIADSADKCPLEAEDFDGFEDADGCPEQGSGLVQLTCEKIEIKEAVYFDTGSDRIQERSFGLLEQVAGVLQNAAYVRHVRVEGHTDDRGKPEYNLELSKRRAASVMQYLIDHGISADRLDSDGFGLTKPIADNKTEAGRGHNRRVEFVVTEQAAESCR